VIREQWYESVAVLNNICLNDLKDIPIWKWTGSKKFLVESIYTNLTGGDNGYSFREIWKAKILEKIKIFMRLIAPKAILTKDNMLRKK
jgi:hypothetical protein